MAEEPEGGAGVAEDWRSLVPDELKHEPFVEQATDFSNFVKQAVDAHKSFGARVPLPKGEATPEQIKEFVSKAAPAAPDQYQIDWDQGVEWNEEARPKFLDLLHKNGLMEWQAKGIVQGYTEIMKEFAQSQEALSESEALKRDTELQRRFGNTLPEVQTKAQRAIQHIGQQEGLGKKAAGLIEQAGLTKDPDFLQWAATLHEAVTEDSWAQGEARTVMTPQEAQKKADAMYNLPKEHPFKDSSHHDHRAACAEQERLRSIAAGI